MFWKILSSSGVMAGLFSKVTNLQDGGGQTKEGEKKRKLERNAENKE